MPAFGEQHKTSGGAIHNPFEEVKPVISEYTALEIATLQARLNRKLGPEFISTRSGPGGAKVAYLPAEKAINLANEVFGFNGWSSSIQGIQIDFVDENAQKGTISIGLSVTVRVTLRDGTYHEDTGYGGIENCKSKIAAFEKAKKEGTTDALKRALRNFGNVLGNCIYDKDYIAKVAKVKAGQGRWDVNELHRHADYQEKKDEPISRQELIAPPTRETPLVAEDSFDVNDFDEADFDEFSNADAVTLPPDTDRAKPVQHPRQPQHQMTPSKPPQRTLGPNDDGQVNGLRRPPGPAQMNGQLSAAGSGPISRSSSPGVASQHFAPQPQAPPDGPKGFGFYSARDAEALDGNNMPTGKIQVTQFNPHAESPSIPKTSGVDHSKSLALGKGTLKHEPLVPLAQLDSPRGTTAGTRPGVPTTRPGAVPTGTMRSTSAYRPPLRHGAISSPAATTPTAAGVKRPPLSDVSNLHNGTGSFEETKRPRIGPGLPGGPPVGNGEIAEATSS